MSKTTDTRSLGRRIYAARHLYLMLLPTFALLLLFDYFPAACALIRSFFDWDIGGQSDFIGLANFREMFEDEAVLTGALNMLKLLAFGLVLPLLMPLLTAAMIHGLPSARSSSRYRLIFTIPMAIPGIVILLLWTFVYAPSGLLNESLELLTGSPINRNWLGDGDTALYAIMGISFPWAGGLGMLVFYSGFCAIPPELGDSAMIDGAGWFIRFWRINLPLVMGQIRMMMILGIILGIQGFENVLILTNGGPGYRTMVPGLRMYQAAFLFGRMGYGCAIGATLFVLIMLLTLVMRRYVGTGIDTEPV